MSGLSDMGIARKRDSSPQLVPNTVISTEAQPVERSPYWYLLLLLLLIFFLSFPKGICCCF